MQTFELEAQLDRPLRPGEISWLREQLEAYPVDVLDIYQDGSTLHLRYQCPEVEGVGFAWWLLLLVPVGIVSWKFFTWEPEEMLRSAFKLLLPVAAVGLGVYLLVMRR